MRQITLFLIALTFSVMGHAEELKIINLKVLSDKKPVFFATVHNQTNKAVHCHFECSKEKSMRWRTCTYAERIEPNSTQDIILEAIPKIFELDQIYSLHLVLIPEDQKKEYYSEKISFVSKDLSRSQHELLIKFYSKL